MTRILPKALMVPPGFPDFMTRRRFVDAGGVLLTGRAWSGHAPVAKVEVELDGRWVEADLGPAGDRYAWRRWECAWDATPGEHVLRGAGGRRGRPHPTRRPAMEPAGHGQQHRPAGAGDRPLPSPRRQALTRSTVAPSLRRFSTKPG